VLATTRYVYFHENTLMLYIRSIHHPHFKGKYGVSGTSSPLT